MNLNPFREASFAFREASFDPETTHVMGQAFEFACLALKDREDFESLKEKMAIYIVNAARNGERDPVRLSAKAVKACAVNGKSLSISNLHEVARHKSV